MLKSYYRSNLDAGCSQLFNISTLQLATQNTAYNARNQFMLGEK